MKKARCGLPWRRHGAIIAAVSVAASGLLEASLVHADDGASCHQAIKAKLREAVEKGRSKDWEGAEGAALSAYVWSALDGQEFQTLAAAGALMWVMAKGERELEAAAVACAALTAAAPRAEEPGLRAAWEQAQALCAKAGEQRLALLLELPEGVECGQPVRWLSEVTRAGAAVAARRFTDVPSAASVTVRIIAPPAPPASRAPTPGPVLTSVRWLPSWMVGNAASHEPSRADRAEPSTWWCAGDYARPCALGALGALTLAGAGLSSMRSHSLEEEADRLCPGRDACASPALARAANNRLNRAADVALVSGLLLALGSATTVGAAFWYWGIDDAAEPPVEVSCTGTGCQLWATGSF